MSEEAAESVEEATEAVEESAEPDEAAQPDEATEPVEGATELTEEAAEPVEGATELTEEVTELVEPEPDQSEEKQPSTKKKKNLITILINLNASVKDQLHKHYITFLPEFLPGSDTYRPVFYTFRAPIKEQTGRLKQITGKPPPFYVLFDHSIAVVWSLFNKELKSRNLGIVQLHWALYFLESISNTELNPSNDLQFCIDTIRDHLIDAYSDLSEESVIYGNATLKEYMPKEKSQVFSWNYSNLFNRCPVQQDAELTDSKLLEELENIKQLVGIDSVDLSNVQSREQVMDVLKKWQKEQLIKTQEDVKMLHVVEDMIKNLGGTDFEEYTYNI